MVKQGYLKYKYTLTIDLENLVDKIMAEMGGYYDTYEFEGDGDKLVIRGEDTTYFKEYITPSTILDPPEDELVYDSIKDYAVEAAVIAALHDTDSIKVDVEVDEDSIRKEEE
jgi:hypothetical protein